jgi:flagellar biosynthesis/type III secretory pathway protein FliH
LPSPIAGEGIRVRTASFPTFADVLDPEALAARAEEERRQALAAAREEGRAEGRQAAVREWSDRLATATTALEAVARQLASNRVAMAADLARETTRLILLLGRKVMRRELDLAASGTAAAIEAVSERLLGTEGAITVRMDAATAEAFEAWRREATPALSVRVHADPALGPGDWVIETRDGFLDGRLASQVEEAWRVLEETWR